MSLTLFLISMRSCDFFSLPPGKEEKTSGFLRNLEIRWSDSSLDDLCWSVDLSRDETGMSPAIFFSPDYALTYFNVLHSLEERCSGLSLTSWCPVVFLIRSGFWCQRPAGQNGGQEKHLHRNALLDGPGGHCLWWKPWCHLRLQGTKTSIVVLLCTSLQM